MILEPGFAYDSIVSTDYSTIISDLTECNYLYIMEKNDFDDIGLEKIHFNNRASIATMTDALIELFTFKHNKVEYVCFYVEVPVRTYSDYPVKRFGFKLKDTYVTNKMYSKKSIRDVMHAQAIEREKIGLECISTPYLNELCANKIEYALFLTERKLMYNTKLVNHVYGREYRHKYIKVPYSRRSNCTHYETFNDMNCHTDDLLVVQDRNRSLQDYEMRCYCIDGEVDFILVKRNESKKDYLCVRLDKETKVPDAELKKLLNKHGSDLKKICKKTFDAMNRLIHYRMSKLKYEKDMAEYIAGDVAYKSSKYKGSRAMTTHDKKTIVYVLTSLVNSRKKMMIDYLNGTYGKMIDDETFTRPVQDYSTKEDEYPVYDHFMRIDIALPDGKKFDKMMVLDVKPFSSERVKYRVIKDCVDDGSKFKASFQYLLSRIVKKNADKFTELV